MWFRSKKPERGATAVEVARAELASWGEAETRHAREIPEKRRFVEAMKEAGGTAILDGESRTETLNAVLQAEADLAVTVAAARAAYRRRLEAIRPYLRARAESLESEARPLVEALAKLRTAVQRSLDELTEQLGAKLDADSILFAPGSRALELQAKISELQGRATELRERDPFRTAFMGAVTGYDADEILSEMLHSSEHHSKTSPPVSDVLEWLEVIHQKLGAGAKINFRLRWCGESIDREASTGVVAQGRPDRPFEATMVARALDEPVARWSK